VNVNGIVWKQLTDGAEAKKSVLYKHMDDKALFTGMLRLYVVIYREIKNILQPRGAQAKE
jgi:hypothetical protein